MQSTKLKQAGTNVGWLLGGCLGGLVMAAMVTAGLWWGVKWWGSLPPATTGPVPEGVRPLSDREVRNLLEQAQAELDAGHPQAVREVLFPRLERIEKSADRARVFHLLGDAEASQSNWQTASGYYRQLADLEPTGEHLLLLGQAYEWGGSLCEALEAYRTLLNSTKQEDYPYLEEAFYAATHLEEVLIDSPCSATPMP